MILCTFNSTLLIHYTRSDLIHFRLDLIHLTYLLGLLAGTEISTDSMEGVWFEKDPRGGAARIFSLFSAPPETHGEPRHCRHFEQDHRSSSLLSVLHPF